jgi:hypothetical protein
MNARQAPRVPRENRANKPSKWMMLQGLGQPSAALEVMRKRGTTRTSRAPRQR